MAILAETFRMAPPGDLAITAAVCIVGAIVVIALPFLIPFIRTFRRQPREISLEDRLAASDWGLGLTGGLLWLIGAALALALAYDFNVSVELRADALHIEGGLFAPRHQGAPTDALPLSALRIAEARVLADRSRSGHVTSRRTSGLGLPGLQSGWFRLANGQSAYVYLVDAPATVLLPTTEGYVFLLDLQAPRRFLQALQRRHAAPPPTDSLSS
jgi:hypothetical protein